MFVLSLIIELKCNNQCNIISICEWYAGTFMINFMSAYFPLREKVSQIIIFQNLVSLQAFNLLQPLKGIATAAFLNLFLIAANFVLCCCPLIRDTVGRKVVGVG